MIKVTPTIDRFVEGKEQITLRPRTLWGRILGRWYDLCLVHSHGKLSGSIRGSTDGRNRWLHLTRYWYSYSVEPTGRVTSEVFWRRECRLNFCVFSRTLPIKYIVEPIRYHGSLNDTSIKYIHPLLILVNWNSQSLIGVITLTRSRLVSFRNSRFCLQRTSSLRRSSDGVVEDGRRGRTVGHDV